MGVFEIIRPIKWWILLYFVISIVILVFVFSSSSRTYHFSFEALSGSAKGLLGEQKVEFLREKIKGEISKDALLGLGLNDITIEFSAHRVSYSKASSEQLPSLEERLSLVIQTTYDYEKQILVRALDESFLARPDGRIFDLEKFSKKVLKTDVANAWRCIDSLMVFRARKFQSEQLLNLLPGEATAASKMVDDEMKKS